MPPRSIDARWIAARRGTLSVRGATRALGLISRAVARGVGDLALEKVARTGDPFHVLVACVISLRTKDEVTDVAAPRLLGVAPTPDALAALPTADLEKLIYPAGFYRVKARQLKEIARRLIEEHGGRVPEEIDRLVELPGVGRKTANLVRTEGHGLPGICVDTHVHRITNRLGLVRSRHPDETELVLRAVLPRRWWIPINEILVAFGRTVCAPVSPRCSSCVCRGLCHRVGVATSR